MFKVFLRCRVAATLSHLVKCQVMAEKNRLLMDIVNK